MRTSKYLTVATLAASVVLAACSSSTGPSPQKQAQTLALHFDSLYVTAHNLSTGGHPAYSVQAQVATFAEYVAYEGAVSSSIAVSSASGGQSWKALQLQENSGVADSMTILLAYGDPNLHNVLIASFAADGSLDQVDLVDADTIMVNTTGTKTGTTAHTAVGGACTAATGTTNPGMARLANSSCLQATFQTSLSVAFPATDGVDASLTSLSMTNASIKGVRMVDLGPVASRIVSRALAHRTHVGT